MAAEALTKAAHQKGHTIKVETQGAFGTECELTPQDIEEADFVILALGTTLPQSEKEKFAHKKVVERPIGDVLKNPDKLIDDLAKVDASPRRIKRGYSKRMRQYFFRHLMKGMSYMIPLAVAAGLLASVASMGTGSIPEVGTYRGMLYHTGLIGLNLMMPVLAVGIAFSIGDKPAIAPALIGGYLMTNYKFLDTNYSSGLLGAILVGFLGGYLVKAINQIKLSGRTDPVMKFLITPFVGTLVMVTAIHYIISPVVSFVMRYFMLILDRLSLQSTVLVCVILGVMIVSDMGGPINKTAYLFALGMAAEGEHIYFGVVALTVILPAAGVGLATIIAPDVFEEEELENGKSALLLGLMGVSEPAILYALNDPFPVMGAQIIGAIVTSILGCLYGVKRIAPGINVIDPLFGNVRPAIPFYCILAVGIGMTCFLVIIFKKIRRWQHV